MAQSATTVTPPNPTPPTNMSFTGTTGPNPPNYTRGQTFQGHAATAPTLPPFYDDGAAGSVYVFATNTAALTGGVSASDTGTGTTVSTATAGAGGSGVNSERGTYHGATSGLVPAATTQAHEAAGTETSATGAGNINYTYPNSGVLDTNKFVGVGPAATAASIAAGPNASHASTLSPTTAPTLTSIATAASGVGTTTCTATGTGFNRQSVIYVSGIAYPTTFTSSTTISCTAPKKATAGTLPVNVVTGGVITTATVNWTFT